MGNAAIGAKVLAVGNYVGERGKKNGNEVGVDGTLGDSSVQSQRVSMAVYKQKEDRDK